MSGSEITIATVRADLDAFFAANEQQINAGNFHGLEAILSRATLIPLIESILADPTALEEIAACSYPHVLGFNKIVLINPDEKGDDSAYQLRLHIWWPGGDGCGLVEGKHCHRWNYASTVIAGVVENQKHFFRELSDEERAALAKLDAAISGLGDSDIQAIDAQFEMLETLRLAREGSHMAKAQGGVETLQEQVDKPQLAKQLGLTEAELDVVIAIHGKYSAQEKSGGGYALVHSDDVVLEPAGVDIVPAGQIYFGPIECEHRLFIGQSELTATLMVTAPVLESRVEASFQRPTGGHGEEIGYEREMYTADTLRAELQRFLEVLRTPERGDWRSRAAGGDSHGISP